MLQEQFRHCTMTDLAGVREFLPLHAPPTQP
jgi:hypothetical protein